MKNLVIVESPTKARTLSAFLGKDYEILASMGHVRDLPRGEFGVDVQKDFSPKYVIPKEKIKSVNSMAKTAAEAQKLWLATDPDREGEAIAWNLLQVIREKSPGNSPSKKPKLSTLNSIPYERVVFHEITRDAVMDAFDHPRKIDEDLVSAQQARRVLDRLVGYKLSPLLWKKVKSKLSAGRVQSVALRLVVEREREIEAFKSEEYWEIWIEVSKVSKESEGTKGRRDKVEEDIREVVSRGLEIEGKFSTKLVQVNGKKAEIKNKTDADKVVGDLESATYKVLEVKAKDARKYPNPPFTTSTMQQAAANRLGFVPKRTMRIAQGLYEKGLITYMRTDSVNLSPKAVDAARKYIEKNFGKEYLPEKPRFYKVKSKLAQEAHEAIRPTNVTVDSKQLTVDSSDERKLYDLIHKRMVVCQMAEAVIEETAVDVEAITGSVGPQKNQLKSAEISLNQIADSSEKSDFRPAVLSLSKDEDRKLRLSDSSAIRNTDSSRDTEFSEKNHVIPKIYLLRANGQRIKFDGWYKVYEKAPIKEQVLPKLEKDENLNLVKIDPQQKFTEPPPRYTEATLIRDLEKNGIGRPSTYAPTISTLYDRAYIERLEAKKIAPTPVGKAAVDFLMKHFADIFDYSFTAAMEDDLDKIAQGEKDMVSTMKEFWEPFEKQVDKVMDKAEKVKVEVEETDEICDKCGKPMVIRYGRFGKFLACSGFPDCKNTKTLAEDTGIICPQDGGKVVVKRTRRGKPFWGCENWPDCKFAAWKKPSFASSSVKTTDDKKATEGKPATTEDTESKNEGKFSKNS